MATTTFATETVNVALLGSGTFVKDAYVPLLERFQSQAQVTAVWSRSEKSSKSLCADAATLSAAKVTFGEEGLAQVLQDSSIDAIIVVLPAHVAVDYTIRALQAGKCVLCEKPIAATAAAAQQALHAYRSLPRPPVWSIAENYRYENCFLEAVELVPQLGTVSKIDVVADMPMNRQNKYYASDWRRNLDLLPGGFMTDTSVHYIAGLRLLAAAAGGGQALTVRAITRAFPETGLSPPDTALAVLSWESGLAATFTACLAASQPRYSMVVTGLKGTLEVSRGGWHGSRSEYVLTHRLEGDAEPTVRRFGFQGLDNEMAAFVKHVGAFKQGKTVQEALAGDERGLPEQGLNDLAMVEAIIRAGASGETVHIQPCLQSPK